MKRGMNKRGQFYLLAAMIIITLIVGFASVSNYAQKKSDVKVYDLKDELNIESGKVLEYGTFSNQMETGDFIEKYAIYAGENKEIYFVYGNENQIEFVRFGAIVGSVSLAGEEPSNIPVMGEEYATIIPQGKKTVDVTIGINSYEFELKPGQNFFFVISQEVEGEQHIVTS